MAGLALSPGMRTRISKGYYAFPHEEWDCVSDTSKRSAQNFRTTLYSFFVRSRLYSRLTHQACRPLLYKFMFTALTREQIARTVTDHVGAIFVIYFVSCPRFPQKNRLNYLINRYLFGQRPLPLYTTTL